MSSESYQRASYEDRQAIRRRITFSGVIQIDSNILSLDEPFSKQPLPTHISSILHSTIMSGNQKVRQADGLLMHIHDAAQGPM
jgi:energy-coupling factor transporter ATP-binding protein EcfA2